MANGMTSAVRTHRRAEATIQKRSNIGCDDHYRAISHLCQFNESSALAMGCGSRGAVATRNLKLERLGMTYVGIDTESSGSTGKKQPKLGLASAFTTWKIKLGAIGSKGRADQR